MDLIDIGLYYYRPWSQELAVAQEIVFLFKVALAILICFILFGFVWIFCIVFVFIFLYESKNCPFKICNVLEFWCGLRWRWLKTAFGRIAICTLNSTNPWAQGSIHLLISSSMLLLDLEFYHASISSVFELPRYFISFWVMWMCQYSHIFLIVISV